MKLQRVELVFCRIAARQSGRAARSMLSPPSRRCSPTAMRSSCSSPPLLGDGDQREVGGAAADIDDQDEVARFDLLAPVRIALDPGVEGGLRFFEDGDFGIAGELGGALRQVTRGGVERSGNGEQHRLVFELGLRMFQVPSRAQVHRYCVDASTGEILGTPSGAASGSSGCVGSEL